MVAWQEHAAKLKARCDALNERGFGAIRFRGPGTDLTVGLLPASRWMCATFTTETGIEHIPNLPTEEVFTSPDWRRTQGTVRSTYPLLVPGVGVLVEGLELRFDDGKVVDVRATEGGAAVEAQLESDEQARFLGEIARRRRRLRRQALGARLQGHAVRRERDVPPRLRPGAADGGRRRRRPVAR